MQNLGIEFYEGITDIVTQPMKGAKNEGAVGFMKGIGKGSMNMITKLGSGKSLTLHVYNQSRETNHAKQCSASSRIRLREFIKA
jgi:hypothetical protein